MNCPPVLADVRGYSYQTLGHHAQAAGSRTAPTRPNK
jgi:hypothetical protein